MLIKTTIVLSFGALTMLNKCNQLNNNVDTFVRHGCRLEAKVRGTSGGARRCLAGHKSFFVRKPAISKKLN